MIASKWIGMGTLALGLVGGVPSLAKADHVHEGRREVRVETRYDRDEHRFDRDRREIRVERPGIRIEVNPRTRPIYVPAPVYSTGDCDVSVPLANVPGVVLDTVNRNRGGAIDSAEFIRTAGAESYRFVVDAPGGGHLDLRTDCGGRLLSAQRC